MPSKNGLVGHRNPRRFRRNTSIFSTGTAHGANYPSANGTFRVFIGIDRMMTRPASCGAIIHFISSLLEKNLFWQIDYTSFFKLDQTNYSSCFSQSRPHHFCPHASNIPQIVNLSNFEKRKNSEVIEPYEFLWLRRRELNPRPSGYEEVRSFDFQAFILICLVFSS